MMRFRRANAAHLGTLLATLLAGCAHAPRNGSTAVETQPPTAQTVQAAPNPLATQPAPSPPAVAAGREDPPRLPQSDPIPPPARRCPDTRSEATASASFIAKPPIVDLELSVSIPQKSGSFVPGAENAYGGVVGAVKRAPNKVVVRIRPLPGGTTMRVSFGFKCTDADGTLTVDMTFASPLHASDPVTIRSIRSD
jgi:hypothetical protein